MKALVFLFAFSWLITSAQAQTRSVNDLNRRLVESRAVEAVIWGMPAVNFDLMYQAMVRETKGSYNQIVYWSRLLDWKNQTLTPNPDDIAKAVAYGRRIKVYPLSQAQNPAPTTFVDASDVVYDATIPYDLRYFQSLDRFVQAEPWLTRDKAMIDQLKSIGIEKGKPFNPNQATQEILITAVREAQALLESRYEGVLRPYFDTARWARPGLPDYIAAAPGGYIVPDNYPVDSRAIIFSFAFFTPRHPGQGQAYLMTIKDKDGDNFDGGKTYRLTVPPNAPVKLYWSATVYDRATHSLIRGQSRTSRSSQNVGLQKNADGSVDVYFAPKPPPGKESNWVPTTVGGKFEVLFRVYGPEKPFFEKTWKLPDIEKLASQ